MNTYKTKNPMLEQQDKEDDLVVPDWAVWVFLVGCIAALVSIGRMIV